MAYTNDNDDHILVKNIASGDEAAFQMLFDRLMGDVFKLSYSLLLDHQMAEDATQETFVKLWKHAADWQPDAMVKTWLLRITRNHCLDILRKKKNDIKKNHALYKDHLLSQHAIIDISMEKNIDQKKQSLIIKNALFQLPERQREALTLVYYNEVRNLDASTIMGLQPSAFDSLLARARKALCKKLEENKDDLKGYIHDKK